MAKGNRFVPTRQLKMAMKAHHIAYFIKQFPVFLKC